MIPPAGAVVAGAVVCCADAAGIESASERGSASPTIGTARPARGELVPALGCHPRASVGSTVSNGTSAVSNPSISLAQRWNSSTSPPAGSSTSSHGSSSTSSRRRAATRSRSCTGATGKVAREPLQRAGAGRGAGLDPPDVLDVLDRHRDDEVGVGEIVGRELAAAMVVGLHAEAHERGAGAPAHRQALRSPRAAGAHDEPDGFAARIAPAITDRAALPVQRVTTWGIGWRRSLLRAGRDRATYGA